jgi:hypothetical protein
MPTGILGYPIMGSTFCQYSTFKLEAVHFSETLVATYPPFHSRETHKLSYNPKVVFALKKIA